MPLSVHGLCDAEITTPAAIPRERARYATPGVVITPALSTCSPRDVSPIVTRSAIQPLDSRVSCPITTRASAFARNRSCPSARPMAYVLSWVSGNSPAIPRIPSVPNSCRVDWLIRSGLFPMGSAEIFSITTVTRTGVGRTTCTKGSGTNALVVNVSRPIAPVASTGSVVTASTARTCCVGPLIATVAGSVRTLAIRYPAANVPMTRGRTSTSRVKPESKFNRTCPGTIWVTSSSRGKCTCCAVRSKVSRPAEPPRDRVRHELPACRSSWITRSGPRTRTCASGMFTELISRFCRNVMELNRHVHFHFRNRIMRHRPPKPNRQRNGNHFVSKVSEHVALEQIDHRDWLNLFLRQQRSHDTANV